MDGQNFGDNFSSSGILDGTGPTANNTIGLLSPVSEGYQDQVSRPPQDSVDSALLPVYETLDDPKLEVTPVAAEEVTPVAAKVTVFPAPLLDPAESELLRSRWNKIQARFVDEPHSSVELADTLVADLIARISTILAEDHNSLKNEWNQSEDVSTENLRIVLQHYRSFFNRLVD